jgi:hypothetical protein
MTEFKETIGHILIMQLLVAAVIVDKWMSSESPK